MITFLAGPILTVLIASFVIFVALSFAPGDPVSQILGGRSSDADRAAMREKLGLDDPLVVQYWHWLTSALHGDFGTSLTYRQDVTGLIGPRILTTLLLVAMSAAIILVVGIALGLLSGTHERLRPLISAVSGLGVAIPGFVAAGVLISVFAVNLGWFPTYGSGTGFIDRIHHLVLPAIALSLVYTAYITQLTSAAVSEESEKEHVTTSIGRGLPRGIVLRRHVLRNAALPILTASGLTVAGLVAGAVVIEQAFSIEGLGSLLVVSIYNKDYAVVTAASLIIVVVFVVATTIIDLSQTLLDPRLRGDGR